MKKTWIPMDMDMEERKKGICMSINGRENFGNDR
jgi:hypothetical protein